MITIGLIFVFIGITCMALGWFMPAMIDVAMVLIKLGIAMIVVYTAALILHLLL